MVVGNPPQIAFEVRVIDRVEPHQCRKQSQIRFGEIVAGQIALAAKPFFDLIQGREQPAKARFVGRLAAREAAAVDPVVDPLVDHGVDCVDCVAQLPRVKIDPGTAELVEFGVQHANDL